MVNPSSVNQPIANQPIVNPASPTNVSLLMIGCGGFSRRYHVPAIAADPAVTIAGIFDPHPQPEVHALAA
jgi:hypothetical protein